MARGTLHPSKPEGQRRRRNAPAHGETSLQPDDEIRGPELPAGYSEPVRDWYHTWRVSPQAQLFEGTDWMRLRMLAVAVEAYSQRPTAALLSEIRLNEERLGATVVDRMRARMVIDREPVQEAELSPVRDLQSEITARLKRGVA